MAAPAVLVPYYTFDRKETERKAMAKLLALCQKYKADSDQGSAPTSIGLPTVLPPPINVPELNDISNELHQSNFITRIHWMNTEACFPLFFTTSTTVVTRQEHHEPVRMEITPAWSSPRTSRSYVTERFFNLERYSHGFNSDSYSIVTRRDGLQVVKKKLDIIASGIRDNNSQLAYRAMIAQGTSLLPTTEIPDSEAAYEELLMRQQQIFGCLERDANGFLELSQAAVSAMECGPSHTRPTIAIVPYGKLAKLVANNHALDYSTAGDIGPKRRRTGVVSDIEEGTLKDGDGQSYLINGIRVYEAPMLRVGNDTFEPASTTAISGEFFVFSPPDGADYLELKPRGKNSASAVKFTFERIFRECGWFKRAPGSGQRGDSYGSDLGSHLWVMDEEIVAEMLPSQLPEKGPHSNDFFFADTANNNQTTLRSWLTETREQYDADLPHYYSPKPVSQAEIAMVGSLQPLVNNVFEAFDPKVCPPSWPRAKWDVEVRLTKYHQECAWNRNIAFARALVTKRWPTQDLIDRAEERVRRADAARQALVAGDAGIPAADRELADATDASAAFKRQVPNNAPQTLENWFTEPLIVGQKFADAKAGPDQASLDKYILPGASSERTGFTIGEWATKLDFILGAPMQEASMTDIVFLDPGDRNEHTGRTYVRTEVTTSGSDPVHNIFNWNCTYMASCVVENPHKVIVAHNVFCESLGPGNNLNLIDIEEAVRIKEERFVIHEDSPSLYAFPFAKAHIDTGSERPAFDYQARRLATAGLRHVFGTRGEGRVDIPNYMLTNHLFGWDKAKFSNSQEATCRIAANMLRGAHRWHIKGGGYEEEAAHSLLV